MKYILFTVQFFIALIGCAQNLIVTLNNSTVETFPIANIQSIKFGTSSMILNEFDGTVTTWNIQDINNYAFDNTSGIQDIIQSGKSDLSIFPNPSFGEVNIQFQSEETTSISIEIIDAYGNQIRKIYSGAHQGNKTYKWNENVPNGLYYCRIITDNKTITKPIILK